MSALGLLSCVAGLLGGVFGLASCLPSAFAAGYGHVSIAAVPLTMWAMWMRARHSPREGSTPPSPIGLRHGITAPFSLALLSVGALQLDRGWIAALCIAPLLGILLGHLRPALAGPPLLFLLLLSPIDHVLDLEVGRELRRATAFGASVLAEGLGIGAAAEVESSLRCGGFTLVVTPACSGARTLVALAALAGALAVFQGLSARALAWLGLAAMIFAGVANASRVAALCGALSVHEPESLELFHDATGIAAFGVAYTLLGALASRLRGRRPGSDTFPSSGSSRTGA